MNPEKDPLLMINVIVFAASFLGVIVQKLKGKFCIRCNDVRVVGFNPLRKRVRI
jgi:hypothetical protein